MSTFSQKLAISLGAAIPFILVNLPITYRFTNGILPFQTVDPNTDCPTAAGRLLHMLVYFAITYLTMNASSTTAATKLKHSVYGTLLFWLVSSPAVFQLLSTIVRPTTLSIATTGGCPSVSGVVLQSILYVIGLVGLMYLPNGSK